MINGLDIYYSKKIGQGLKPISKIINKLFHKELNGLKPISKGKEDHVKNMD